ncbi:MAG: citrate/2-methylcitrate synthase [Clostridiales bacterium]|nr:citrate/2-methylcitrate synthase [Clostridiales bacterium]
MTALNKYSKISEDIEELSKYCINDKIDLDLYGKYDVKRGLRDLNGKGVLTGLTEVSEIVSSKIVDGQTVQCDGELYYRGIDVRELIDNLPEDDHFGFEEASFLLLFGKLPTREELRKFCDLLAGYRTLLPKNYVRDVVMQKPSKDIMNNLARGVLNLCAYDQNPNDLSIQNVLRQSLELIAFFPMISVYSYQANKYYNDRGSFIIHRPLPRLSTAENILHMLRPDSSYTPLEAKILDIALILHAEHGGGNNSTFTTHVVSSSGTDTYSSVCASLCSLKGPKHGGANIMAMKMFAEIKRNVRDWKDEDEIREYMKKILHKEAFDMTGVIYGMGHAVYSISDPRAMIFKEYVRKLSVEKNREAEFQFYDKIEHISAELISKERKIFKGVSANIDFYSGFVYSMLGLPVELYTPLFAIARISGWSAHRIEEINNAGKIIRPAYKCVQERQKYIPKDERI